MRFALLNIQVQFHPPFKNSTSPKIDGGGRIVIGQDLDTMEGLFSDLQSYEGDIADFMLMEGLMTVDDAINYVNCRPFDSKYDALYDFKSKRDLFSVFGKTKFQYVTMYEICKEADDVMMIYTVPLAFEESRKFCLDFGGNLLVPKNEIENNRTFEMLKNFSTICLGTFSTAYWYGIKGDIDSGVWSNTFNENPITWDSFAYNWNLVTDDRKCVSAGGVNYALQWFSSPCSSTACPVCNFESYPKVRIRGLCSNSRFEHSFVLHSNQQGMWSFEGLYRTRIFYNGTHWIMINRDNKKMVATMLQGDDKVLPLGYHHWKFMGDVCASNVRISN